MLWRTRERRWMSKHHAEVLPDSKYEVGLFTEQMRNQFWEVQRVTEQTRSSECLPSTTPYSAAPTVWGLRPCKPLEDNYEFMSCCVGGGWARVCHGARMEVIVSAHLPSCASSGGPDPRNSCPSLSLRISALPAHWAPTHLSPAHSIFNPQGHLLYFHTQNSLFLRPM